MTGRRPEMFRPQLLGRNRDGAARRSRSRDDNRRMGGPRSARYSAPEDIIAYGSTATGRPCQSQEEFSGCHSDGGEIHPEPGVQARGAVDSGGPRPGSNCLGRRRACSRHDRRRLVSYSVSSRVTQHLQQWARSLAGLPQGRKGAAFLTYPNFKIYLEWNQSFIYTTSAPISRPGLRCASLSAGQSGTGARRRRDESLQTRCRRLVTTSAKIDGILVLGTRAALQKEQLKLGLPPTAGQHRACWRRFNLWQERRSGWRHPLRRNTACTILNCRLLFRLRARSFRMGARSALQLIRSTHRAFQKSVRFRPMRQLRLRGKIWLHRKFHQHPHDHAPWHCSACSVSSGAVPSSSPGWPLPMCRLSRSCFASRPRCPRPCISISRRHGHISGARRRWRSSCSWGSSTTPFRMRSSFLGQRISAPVSCNPQRHDAGLDGAHRECRDPRMKAEHREVQRLPAWLAGTSCS